MQATRPEWKGLKWRGESMTETVEALIACGYGVRVLDDHSLGGREWEHDVLEFPDCNVKRFIVV